MKLMNWRFPKICLTLFLALFFAVSGSGSSMVCKAAVPTCCKKMSVKVQAVSSTASLSRPACCTISQAPAADPGTLPNLQVAQVMVPIITSLFALPQPASLQHDVSLVSDFSPLYQPPIFLLKRTLLI